MNTQLSILIVEDEALVAEDLKEMLRGFGFEVSGIADTGEKAIALTGEHRPDLVLMDINLSGAMDGIMAGGEIRSRWGIPIIYVTAYATQAIIDRAKKTVPSGYILKPFNERQIQTAIEIALYNATIERQLKEREQTIRALLNAVPDALVLLDGKKQIVAANESMSQKLKMPRDALEGTSIDNLIASGGVRVQVETIDEVYRTGQTVYLEEMQGEQSFETAIYPVREPDGSIARIAIQSHDITWRKRLEDELKKTGVAQIEHNMEQFQILNDQIRNPLQVIMLYMEMSGGEFRPKIEEQIRSIDSLVAQLDRGWLESEKVRSFLLRHYQHGAGNLPEQCESDAR